MGCAGSKKKGSLEVTPDHKAEETKVAKPVSGVTREEYRNRHRGVSPTSTELPPDPPPVPKIQGRLQFLFISPIISETNYHF